MITPISYGTIWFIGDCVSAVVDEGRSPYEFINKLQSPNIRLSEWTFVNFLIPCYANLLNGTPMKADVPSFMMIYFQHKIAKEYGRQGLENGLRSLRGGLEHRIKKGFVSNRIPLWIESFETLLSQIDTILLG